MEEWCQCAYRTEELELTAGQDDIPDPDGVFPMPCERPGETDQCDPLTDDGGIDCQTVRAQTPHAPSRQPVRRDDDERHQAKEQQRCSCQPKPEPADPPDP